MTTQHVATQRGWKSRIKSVARATVGRIPVVGKIARRVWRRTRLWWHMPHRTDAILTTVQTNHLILMARLDQLEAAHHSVSEMLVTHVGWVLQNAEMIRCAVNDLGSKLSETKNDLRQASIEQRQVIAGDLQHIETQYIAVESAIKRLHDQHASTYERLNETGRQSAKELAELVNTLYMNRVISGEIADGTRNHTKWLEQINKNFDGVQQWLNQLTVNHDNINRWLDAISQGVHSNSNWLEATSNNLHGNSAWLTVISRKLEMMAMDLRERVAVLPESGSYIAAEIVDQDRYQERVNEQGGKIRLNLGSGEKPLPDYLNCDMRRLPETHIVADIRALPFENGTVDEIASSHLVEHFRQHHLETVILPYWKSLLKTDGTLRIICPNWEAMIERLNTDKMTMEEFKQVTFGGQDYQGDDHFAMYTPATLKSLLERVGFHSVEIVTEVRMNGLCPEMEITAKV